MKGFLVLFVLSIFSCSCNEKIKNVDYFPCYSKNNKETREHSNDISLEIDNNSICDNEFFLFGNPYEIFIKHMRSRTYTKIQFYNNGALKEKTIIYWDSSLCKMLTTGFKYFYDLRGNLDGLEYWENDTAL
ncbi:MAG: hypothetical protein HYZ16_02645, partial [Bacteroidetes bacterium]|nr:hypothetical protein [Bacteroidota bacterium]